MEFNRIILKSRKIPLSMYEITLPRNDFTSFFFPFLGELRNYIVISIHNYLRSLTDDKDHYNLKHQITRLLYTARQATLGLISLINKIQHERGSNTPTSPLQ